LPNRRSNSSNGYNRQEVVPMPVSGSVTVWIEQLKAGDVAAVAPLWQGYFRRLVGLARQRLGAAPRGAADEEDVALSAFASFCRAAAQGRFPRLEDRDDLWQVLMMLTARKAINLIERECSQKRGGPVAPTVSMGCTEGASQADALAIPAPGPTPELAAELAEECRRRLEVLGDDELRAVVVDKLEGYSSEEIAARRGWSLSKVERKLRLIRKTWEGETCA
jgi:DNA-directed RNA polymerase specialized sigma24 family protein